MAEVWHRIEMDIDALLIELHGRIAEHVGEALDGLDPALLTKSPAPGANTIGWLIWHLTRVQDHHVSELLDEEQLWVTADWAQHFGVDPDPQNTGYGHEPDEVAAIQPDGVDVLRDYYAAVAKRTEALLARTTSSDLERVVDRRWDPPVTLGVRLISVFDDDIMHAGQATYLRGLLT
ncbi:MAG: chorismate synthase [Ilumatobacteraceae bacterium]|nr:chorismate synthase [Ilumatobacteraceae bacterium]MCU1388571.1 chorismate synthase [Ilumatobacteraceae bacterium]